MAVCARVVLFVAVVSVFAPPVPAQVPGTDIYLAPLSERSGRVTIGAPRNVTRRAGYDNQPAFLDAGSFLYAAGDSTGATDVFRYEIAAARSVRVTDTPESEYSPTPIAGGASFSAVRVELDGTQRLWRFGMDGGSPRLVAADVDSVGYHVWRDEHTLVLFIVGAPHSLRVVDTDLGTETLVAMDVGRSLHRIPGSDEVSFLERVDGGWWIMSLDTDTGVPTPLAEALAGSEDCAWTRGGSLLMAKAGRVFVLDSDRGGWTPVVAFGEPGLEGVTRLAVDPTGRWLALVGADGE